MAKKRRNVRSSARRGFPILPVLGIVAGLAFLALLGYAIWGSFQTEPSLGEAVPIVGAEHIPDGARATDYNSDPPTSGQHYEDPAPGGFYDVAPLDENLVHNLEHGYIVLYYNCSQLDDNACESLKGDIRQAMDAAGVTSVTGTPKLVAAPRPTMDNLVTFTSWGRIYREDTFDRDDFLLFVQQNRNRAPEPQAP